jgi:predicted  nucleic acid-binding Zn-ribbon protein
VSPTELLARLEEQAEKLAAARVRGQQLERALRAERERRGKLESALEAERSRRASAEREVIRLHDEIGSSVTFDDELERAQEAAAGLERELQATRMQLEAVRAELASARVPLSERLRPRKWR